MKIKLVHGSAKSGKTSSVVSRFINEPEKNPVIITPSSESVYYLKTLILSKTTGFFGQKILTFDHLINGITENYKEISAIEKYFILREIVSKTNLKYFNPIKNYTGFYEQLSHFISELKSGEIAPKDFDKSKKEKDQDIYAIYSAYQEELHKQNCYDHEGKFWQGQYLIDKGNLGPLSDCKLLLIDGFHNFSPVESKIIDSLKRYVDEIIITQTTEEWPKLVLSHVPINIISCPGHLREVEEIAREIKRQVIYSGRKPDDIAILFRDLNEYRDLIIDVFNRYGIPFSISCGTPLIKLPEVRNKLRDIRESGNIANEVLQLLNIPEIFLSRVDYNALVYTAESTESPAETYKGGEVRVLDVHRARNLSFPVVFVGGLIEKSFPKQITSQPIYNDFERDRLRKQGINVEGAKEKQKDEMFLFMTAVHTASETLYITYPYIDNSGREELVSYYIDEIKKLYPSSIKEKKIHLSHIIPDFTDIYTKEQFNMRNPTPNKELLNIPIDVKDNFGPEYKWSPSQLDEYGTCPFIFFAKRVLELEPIEEITDEIKPNEEGILYHAILREYYADGGDIMSICEKHFKDAPIKNIALWKIKKEEILNNLKRIVQYKKDTPPYMGIKRTPAFFEISFDSLKIGDIQVRGIIDRIDLTESGLFVVIDYKSGGKIISLTDVLKGKYLQLPIYVMAATDVLEVGVDCLEAYLFYIKKRKYYHASALTHYKKTKGKLSINPLWDEYMSSTRKYIIKYVDAVRKGEFPVKPNGDCPSYCDYKDICRI